MKHLAQAGTRGLLSARCIPGPGGAPGRGYWESMISLPPPGGWLMSGDGDHEQGSVGSRRETQAEPRVLWGWMGWPALLERNLESSPEPSPPLKYHLPRPPPVAQASLPGLRAPSTLQPWGLSPADPGAWNAPPHTSPWLQCHFLGQGPSLPPKCLIPHIQL